MTLSQLTGRALRFGVFALLFPLQMVRGQIADFRLGGRDVVVHGFLSQGFMKSDGNDFLTADTSSGTFKMTEGALNVASNITDKLHVGVQVYGREIGRLGGGKPKIDWAYADYRAKDWLGFRGGKVKTPLGLYNDTQDMDFLHPWALLPQSVYPTDLRSLTIAHTGGDVYGTVGIGRAGSVTYQAYGGKGPEDKQGGFNLSLADVGFSRLTYSTVFAGYDVRWATPVKGLRLGTSYMNGQSDLKATYSGSPATADLSNGQYAGYAEYRRGGLTLASEYRAQSGDMPVVVGGQQLLDHKEDATAFFASVAFRVNRWLQLGTYRSRFHSTLQSPDGHTNINDQTATVRFDFLRYWNLKIEGHFMDTTGSLTMAHGFYPSDLAQGLKPRTNLLVVRLGFNL